MTVFFFPLFSKCSYLQLLSSNVYNSSVLISCLPAVSCIFLVLFPSIFPCIMLQNMTHPFVFMISYYVLLPHSPAAPLLTGQFLQCGWCRLPLLIPVMHCSEITVKWTHMAKCIEWMSAAGNCITVSTYMSVRSYAVPAGYSDMPLDVVRCQLRCSMHYGSSTAKNIL